MQAGKGRVRVRFQRRPVVSPDARKASNLQLRNESEWRPGGVDLRQRVVGFKTRATTAPFEAIDVSGYQVAANPNRPDPS